MLKNTNFFVAIILVTQFIHCSSSKKISSIEQSPFYSIWDHSVVPPIESPSDIPSTQAPPKKKK